MGQQKVTLSIMASKYWHTKMISSFFPTADKDFIPVSEALILNSSKNTTCFTGSIHIDGQPQMNKTFTLELNSSTPAVTLQPSIITITIIGDDGIPSN